MIREKYEQVRNWIYRNGRNIEICQWKYFFENGYKRDVADALMEYQNEDGGFGHALEADNWNPESTPVTTNEALRILQKIEFTDMSHPIYQGIWKYLNSQQDLMDYGWKFTVPSNDNYPHAPWWNYSEEQNRKEYYGVTAMYTSFILKHGDPETKLYQKALKFADELMNALQKGGDYGDMGLEGLIVLVQALQELKFIKYDFSKISKLLADKVKTAIENNKDNWALYGVRPSDFVNTADSPFYEDNRKLLDIEMDFLLNTLPEDDVWGITWTWFDNMEKYEDKFRISENWWKGQKAIEKMLVLREFGRI